MPAPTDAVPPVAGLDDLSAMTFDCPRAALNAAAREAAQAPSQGTYQFAYFRIVNASHHASYEVQFTSNYAGERGPRILRRALLPAGLGSADDEGVRDAPGTRGEERPGGRSARRRLRPSTAAGAAAIEMRRLASYGRSA